MSAGEINVEPSLLREKASRIRHAKEQIEEISNKVKNIINSIGDVIRTTGVHRYAAFFYEREKLLEGYLESIENFARYIDYCTDDGWDTSVCSVKRNDEEVIDMELI